MKLLSLIANRSQRLVPYALVFAFALPGAAEATGAKKNLNIMFYNVLNLFDNKKDYGKEDWTYLPIGYPRKKENCMKMSNPYYRKDCLETDWTSNHIKLKLSQLRKAISANQRRFLPDILGLCEVENHGIVQAMAQGLGYDPRAVITTKSPDNRGIDVALIYRPSATLKYRSHREYKVVVEGAIDKPTRNILEVEFIVGGKYQLFVYVNHWPSQAAPAPARVRVAQMVRTIVNKRMQANPQVNIIVTGDFNTIPSDRPHPFHDALLKSPTPEMRLFDVHGTFMRHPKIPDPVKQRMPKGTYWYGRNHTWNLFDRFFVSKSLFDGKGLDFAITSYRIHNPTFLSRPWDLNDGTGRSFLVPWRGNNKTLDPKEAGYSDHYAIKGSLIVN